MSGETREHILAFRAGVNNPLERLAEVTEELIGQHRRLALLLSTEAMGKAEGYMKSHDTTISGREREATIRMVDVSADIFRAKGEIAAFESERDYLRLVLTYASNTGNISNGSSGTTR